MATTNGSAEMKTRLKLDETTDAGMNIAQLSDKISEISGDDAAIVTEIGNIKDAIIAIDARAAIIYTPLQIDPLA